MSANKPLLFLTLEKHVRLSEYHSTGLKMTSLEQYQAILHWIQKFIEDLSRENSGKITHSRTFEQSHVFV